MVKTDEPDERSSIVTSKGQVTIPSELRQALNMKRKDRVAFELFDGEIRLGSVGSRAIHGYGAVRPQRKPEDFRRVRREVEDEMGKDVVGGGFCPSSRKR